MNWPVSSSSAASLTVGASVVGIGDYAVAYCTKLTSGIIPNSVTNVGDAAFASCTNLARIYFQGNALGVIASAFNGDFNTTVYYFPGTTGWNATFAGRPMVLWNPQV